MRESSGWSRRTAGRASPVGANCRQGGRPGGRISRETHKAVRDAQHGKGSIWWKEEVRLGGLKEGSEKDIGPERQTEGSRRGRTLAQAMQEAGSGVVVGLKRTRLPKSMMPSEEVEK